MKRTDLIIANLACCICGRKSDRVCNECLAINTLACFCEKHDFNHKQERNHIALWSTYGGEIE